MIRMGEAKLTREQTLQELNELIHDYPVWYPSAVRRGLKDARECLENERKVYVVTAGDYSDYHICFVTFDKSKAEGFVKINENDDPRIEEYVPVEFDCDEGKESFLLITYLPKENRISEIYVFEEMPFKDRCYSDKFQIFINMHGRVGKDLLEKGNDSDLALKVCQDRYAMWRYENEVISFGGMAMTQKTFDENQKKGW